jgi:hypothetical protein
MVEILVEFDRSTQSIGPLREATYRCCRRPVSLPSYSVAE